MNYRSPTRKFTTLLQDHRYASPLHDPQAQQASGFSQVEAVGLTVSGCWSYCFCWPFEDIGIKLEQCISFCACCEVQVSDTFQTSNSLCHCHAVIPLATSSNWGAILAFCTCRESLIKQVLQHSDHCSADCYSTMPCLFVQSDAAADSRVLTSSLAESCSLQQAPLSA